MDTRARKRSDEEEQLPADKRACSSTDSKPSSSNATFSEASSSRPSTSTQDPPDVAMEDALLDDEPYNSDSDGASQEDEEYNYHEDGGHGGGNRDELKTTVTQLKESNDPGLQLAILTELCRLLCFCSRSRGADIALAAIPKLVELAGSGGPPDVVLMSVRALTYVIDLDPAFAPMLVKHGVIPIFCGRLMDIEYMDVAEQCLQALAKVSVYLPVQCLHAGAVMACLTYIDFFPVSIQRVALLTVSNILKKLPPDCSSFLVEIIPSLCSVVNSDDHKLVEIAITCLTRMTASTKISAEVLDKLCKHGLVQKCANMISPLSGLALGQATYDDLIRLLANLASGSTEAVQILLEMNISTTLKDILTSNDVSHSTGSLSVINSGSSDQVHEILKLLNQLIPSAFSRDKDTQSSIDKEKILMDQPRLLQQFVEDVIPALVQVANSGASLFICYGCASILNSLLLRDTSDKLLDILKGSNISSFLASLLTRKEQHVLFSALSIVDILLQKHPDVFSDLFVKEGIVCGIDKLLMVEKIDNDVTTQSTLAAHSSVSSCQKAVKKSSRCLCDSLDLCQRSPRKINCILERSTVQTLVKKIKFTYLTLPSNAESGSAKILDKFKSYCCLLNDGVAKGKNEECLSQMVKQVISELCSVEHMSTFEFVESEVLKSLLNYLSNGQYLQVESDYRISLEHHVVVFNRLQAFANMILFTNPPNQETTTLALLVQKLLSVLSSLEDFPVVASRPCKNKNYFAHIPFRGSTLHPCLKINFIKDEKEIILRKYSYGIVNVNTSSSLYDIERCLWPSISPKQTKQSPNSTESTVGCTDCLNDNNADSRDCKVDETHPATKKELQRSDFSYSKREHAAVDLSPDEDANLEVRKLTIASRNATAHDENGKSSTSHSEIDRKGNLVFYLEGKEIDRSLTLYQAILQHLLAVNAGLVVDPKFWNEVYTVSYKRAETQADDSEMSCDVQERRQVSLCDQNLKDLSSMHQPSPSGFDTLSGLSRFSPDIPFLSNLLVARLPCKLEKSNPSYDILFMLKILEGLNRYPFHLLSNERSNSFGKERISEHQYLDLTKPYFPHVGFISVKLTKKLEQQMADSFTLSTSNMPAWCSQLVASCPFLFSFEARQKYFWLTTFSNSQSARNPYLRHSGSATSSFIDPYSHGNTTTRIKFEVDRYQLLESAKKMMASHAHSRVALEVKYREEVGTGLGPTMEFYTLVSHEFQKVGLGLWRGDGNSSNCVDCGFIEAPYGLFPRPWSAAEMSSHEANFAEVVQKFTLLGKLVARALQDRRIFYLPLSKAFYRSILGQVLGIHDILSFDPNLGKTLLQLQSLAIRKRSMDEKGATSCNLLIQGTTLEDLCIDFTLPGYSDYVLTTGGDSIMVDQSNVTNYVSLVVDATVGSGVKKQLEAFKLGFNEVFPIQSLQMFTEDDLDLILCGEQDVWRIEELLENINFDHGYTVNSVAAQNFIEIVSEFQSDQQRAFLQFVTGAPRLPVGGLASLNPKLTVVRKHCSISHDFELPSAMTCANYLKLPAYSSKANMREKLLYAITEGQGSFHLS